MTPDPLSELRDIHYPDPPGWWPPAPGWWLLALAVAAVLGVAAWLLRRRRQRDRPRQEALRLFDAQVEAVEAGIQSSTEYAHHTNRILKRLLVTTGLLPEAASASGARWLATLDQLSDSDDFSVGPGRVLGNPRFTTDMLDTTGLDEVVRALLTKVRVQ